MDTATAFSGELVQPANIPGEAVPHVIAWNLTRRCNLECAHCYISAGPDVSTDGELSTRECLRIIDEVLALNPNPMFILSGGEPLLRNDLTRIAAHATMSGATVVIGTNGTLLDNARIAGLRAAGVSGVAVSIDSLNPVYHDRFRRGPGALAATQNAVSRLRAQGLDFVIQATITRGNRGELAALAAWAAREGAVAFNAYLLIATGRGQRMSALSPKEGEALLGELVALHLEYLGTMMVRAKCAPQFMRLVHQRTPGSPVLNYATRCPCGIHYCRIAPQGTLTACPYLPVPAGELRETSFERIWTHSTLLAELRAGTVRGKCGRCAYREMCGGCRARAYAASGDYLGADPGCVYEPGAGEAPIARAAAPTYGGTGARELRWSADAAARIDRIPSFVRAVVIRRVEDYARRQGRVEVTSALLGDARRAMPVDFARKAPFFLRRGGQ